MSELLDIIKAKTTPAFGCLIWNGGMNGEQARLKFKGNIYIPVRELYRAEGKELKSTQHLRRTCKNVRCVAPWHREVTGQDFDVERLIGRIDRRVTVDLDSAGHWFWDGYHHPRQGAKIRFEGKIYRPVRILYNHYLEPTEERLHRTCDDSRCINPFHYVPSSKYTAPQATKCKNGHDYTEENTYWYSDKRKKRRVRRCKICAQVSTQKYKEGLKDV